MAGQLDNKDKSWGMFNRLHFDNDDSCVIHSRGWISDGDEKVTPDAFSSLNYVCRNVDMTINFWMARTKTVRSIGFDNNFKRFAHKEFFIDGRGKMAIAQCGKPTVHHNGECKQQYGNLNSVYHDKRYPSAVAWTDYLKRWYLRSGLEYLVEKSLLPAPHDDIYGPKDGTEKERFLVQDSS